MRLLLDTVTFIHAIMAPERLSKKAISVLRNTETIHELSVISISEIALKQALGKLGYAGKMCCRESVTRKSAFLLHCRACPDAFFSPVSSQRPF